MGGTVSTALKGVGTGLGAIATGGTSLIPGSPTKKVGDVIGNTLTLGLSGQKGPFPGAPGAGGGMNTPALPSQTTPLQMLTQTGGAPLLMDISLGADVGTSLMGYFGVPGSNANFDQWTNTLNPEDAKAVRALHVQLSQIQQDTNTKNQAVQKLADDYPNIMTQKIQQYSQIADSATQQMMKQAIDQISAKQAAGGTISSGASVQAAADAGAKIAGDKLNYATGLAEADFANKFNVAQGLQSFQQKMLGQGATQGFNAVQNALQRNTEIGLTGAGYQFKSDIYNKDQSNAMYGALGGLAGTVVGGALGGPAGARIGGTLGSAAGGAPRLNFNPEITSYGPTNERNA